MIRSTVVASVGYSTTEVGLGGVRGSIESVPIMKVDNRLLCHCGHWLRQVH